MQIVVEDGTGLPTANALVSVAEATAILSVNPHSQWTSYEPTTQEGLIIWATRLLIERAKWKGTRVSISSGTPFPRSGLKDADNAFYPNDAVPDPVKVAVASLADFLGTFDPTAPNTGSNLKRLDVDVISLQYDMGTSPEKWPSSIAYTLRDIATVSFGKGGGVRIVKH